MRKVIFRTLSGSHLYGVNTVDSDVDYMSVFLPSAQDLLGLKEVKQIDYSSNKSSKRNTCDDTDDVHYSFPQYFKLLIANNPNIIETLFATDACIQTITPEFRVLIENRDKIISPKVVHTFTGYACSQKKKILTKLERYHSLIDAEELLKDQSGVFSYDYAEELNTILKHYQKNGDNHKPFHKGMSINYVFNLISKELDSYGYRVKTKSFAELGYDIKFGYHLIRILAEGKELAETGGLVYPLTGKTYVDIMRIKNEQVSYEELMDLYDEYKEIGDCNLPITDINWCNNFQVNLLRSHLQEDYENR